MTALADSAREAIEALRGEDDTLPSGLAARAGAEHRRRTLVRGRSWIGLAAVALLCVGVLLHVPTPALSGDGLLAVLGLVGLFALLVVEFAVGPKSTAWATIFCGGISACCIMVAAVQPGGTAIVGCYIAVGVAARRLPLKLATTVAVGTVLLVAFMIAIGGPDRVFTILWSAVGFAFTFMISRLARVGQEQHARERALLEEEKRAIEARTEAAALAERGRIAREMHDVLAHSLSALAVELEGTRMLARKHGADSEVEQAIERSHRHAITGLEEARAAIEALRGDDLPGPERLIAMAESFSGEQGVECELEVSGEPRPLASEARLTIYRTAQEALTNIRKHADPERVDIHLEYAPDGTRLEVADHGRAREGSASVNGALGAAGPGYGVSGMRERAELLGGRLVAGPADDGFRVELWLPEAA